MDLRQKLETVAVGAIVIVGALVLFLWWAYLTVILIVIGSIITLIGGIAIAHWVQPLLEARHRRKLEREAQAHQHAIDRRYAALDESKHSASVAFMLEEFRHQVRMDQTYVAPDTYINHGNGRYDYLPPVSQPQITEGKGQKPSDQITPTTSLAPVPAAYDLRQEFRLFTPSREQIFLARTSDGPVLVPVNRLWHMALTGPTGGGKTSILRMVLMQLLYLNCEVVLCDIHYAPIKETADGQLVDWRPIEKRLKQPPLRDVNEMAEWMNWLAFGELKNRIERQYRGQSVGKPLFFTIEELPAVLEEKRDEVGKPLAKILRQGRQYNICFLGASQDLLTSTLKMSSGPRECFRTGYYTGGDQTTARALLDLKQGEKVNENGLGIAGLVYLKTALHPAMQVRTPWASNEALYDLFNVPAQEQLQIGQFSSGEPSQSFTDTFTDDTESFHDVHPTFTGSLHRGYQSGSSIVTGELVNNRVNEPMKPREEHSQPTVNVPSVSPADREKILNLAHAQQKMYGRVVRTKIRDAMGWNNKEYTKIMQVLDEEGL